jgi:hypothetical protein
MSRRSAPLFATGKTEYSVYRLRIRALISADDFDPVKSEFGSLYSGFKGRANKGAVRHALSILQNGNPSLYQRRYVTLNLTTHLFPCNKDSEQIGYNVENY